MKQKYFIHKFTRYFFSARPHYRTSADDLFIFSDPGKFKHAGTEHIPNQQPADGGYSHQR